MRIGIAGTGMIADVMARAMQQVKGIELRAVAGRRLDAAEAFAQRHGVPSVYPDARGLAEAGDVDAIYVATPTGVRESVAVAAARAGKHVLAEKPFLDVGSVRRIVDTCHARGRAFMDATHFVHHPRSQRLRGEREPTIGGARAVRTSFFFPFMDRTNIRFDPAREPMGAIGDMAWYSMRAIVEYMPQRGKLESVSARAVRDSATGAVIRAAGLVGFSDGSTSTFDVGYDAGVCVMDLDILGERGMISLDDFVLDWARGFAFDDPSFDVGYLIRAGMASPRAFQRVSTPSPEPQTVSLLRDFLRVAADPSSEEAREAARAAIDTQELLDAVWAAAR